MPLIDCGPSGVGLGWGVGVGTGVGTVVGTAEGTADVSGVDAGPVALEASGEPFPAGVGPAFCSTSGAGSVGAEAAGGVDDAPFSALQAVSKRKMSSRDRAIDGRSIREVL